MIATETPPATELTELLHGVRTAVDAHVGWSETAQRVAEQLRRHLPTTDVLTEEQRAGSPDDYRAHTLHVEPDGSAPPGDIHRVHNTGDTTAISIHIYGTDVTRVGSSARRYYD